MPENKTNEALEKVKERFRTSEFHSKREDWDRVLHRELPTELPPELTGDQEGLDYQTPDVEKALFDHVDVLKMNPTVYDVLPLDTAAPAKEKARDILLWTTRGWEHENRNRWWDGAVAEGQVRHGIKVMGLRWHPQHEPTVDSDADDETKLKQRDQSFRKRRHPFYWVDADIYGCYWIGDERTEEGPDKFFYEYEIPYVQAKDTFSNSEKKFTLDKLGKIGWLGEGESSESAEMDSNERVCVLIEDSRDTNGRRCPLPDCDHAQRVIKVYVKVSGDREEYDDNPVETYDSPFPGCSYFIIGGRTTSERNPNLRFRPLMYPLYVEAVWQNYLNTMLATIGRTDYADEYFYINLANVPQHVKLPEGGQTMDVERPEPGSGRIPMFPGPVERYPKTMSPHLMELLNQSLKRLEMYLPNRFIQGNAFTEASNATGTAFIQQAQQAALPYNQLLSASDEAQLKSRRFEYHAIQFWAQADPKDAKTKYYAVMTGNTDIAKTKRYTAKPGEVVCVDADKLEMNFDLVVRTKSETLAEEGARWLQVKDQHMYGVATTEQLLRGAGVDDIEGQLETLRAEEVQADLQPYITEIRKRRLIMKASARTGFDFGALMGQPVFDPGANVIMQQPPMADPNQTGGGNAAVPSQPSAPGVTAPNNLMGRSMQQATIAGPDGGGGPLG